MDEVFVVTKGSYSDYHIVGIFSDETKANMFADKFEGTVEPRTLDPFKPMFESGLYPYDVWMQRDGSLSYDVKAREKYLEGYLDEPEKMTDYLHLVTDLDIELCRKYPSSRSKPVSWLHVACMARDEQHAIKIANEKRIRLIAENQWPPDRDIPTIEPIAGQSVATSFPSLSIWGKRETDEAAK